MTTADERRFAFGANWLRFLRAVDERRVQEAETSLVKTLGEREDVAGRTFRVTCGGSLVCNEFVFQRPA